MTTATLQFAASLLAFAFAICAWRIARTPGDRSIRQVAWLIVAVAYLWRGVPEILHNAGAFWALAAREGSAPWEWFVRLSPALNHGRMAITLALAWTMAALPLLRGVPPERVLRGATAAAPVLALVGFYAGWRQGPLSAVHLMSLSILGLVELLGVMLALQVALLARTLDRDLWFFLCIYVVQLAMKVIGYSFGLGFFHGHWYPPGWVFPVLWGLVHLAGIFLASHRLALARSGTPVPPVFEPPSHAPFPARRART